MEFWWCLKRRGAQVCTFGLSGCCVKPRRLRGFTRRPKNSKRAHFRAPTCQTPPKFHEKTPRERRKERILRREREKKAKFWATHPSGPHPLGPHPSGPHSLGPNPSGPQPSGPHPSGPHPSGPHFFWVWAPGLHPSMRKKEKKKT